VVLVDIAWWYSCDSAAIVDIVAASAAHSFKLVWQAALGVAGDFSSDTFRLAFDLPPAESCSWLARCTAGADVTSTPALM